MKKLILVGLLLINSQIATATNWFNINVSSSENETTYIDLDSIEGHYHVVNVWVKTVYPTNQKINDKKFYRETKELWYVDCQNRIFNIGEIIFYTSKGKVVDSRKNYVSPLLSRHWDTAVPDTVGDSITKQICATSSSLGIIGK